MRYKLLISKEAENFFKKHAGIEAEFINAFKVISENSLDNLGKFDIKELQGKLRGLYRLRLGKYRAIFKVISNKLLIILLTVGSRGDVYK